METYRTVKIYNLSYRTVIVIAARIKHRERRSQSTNRCWTNKPNIRNDLFINISDIMESVMKRSIASLEITFVSCAIDQSMCVCVNLNTRNIDADLEIDCTWFGTAIIDFQLRYRYLVHFHLFFPVFFFCSQFCQSTSICLLKFLMESDFPIAFNIQVEKRKKHFECTTFTDVFQLDWFVVDVALLNAKPQYRYAYLLYSSNTNSSDI